MNHEHVYTNPIENQIDIYYLNKYKKGYNS